MARRVTNRIASEKAVFWSGTAMRVMEAGALDRLKSCAAHRRQHIRWALQGAVLRCLACKVVVVRCIVPQWSGLSLRLRHDLLAALSDTRRCRRPLLLGMHQGPWALCGAVLGCWTCKLALLDNIAQAMIDGVQLGLERA